MKVYSTLPSRGDSPTGILEVEDEGREEEEESRVKDEDREEEEEEESVVGDEEGEAVDVMMERRETGDVEITEGVVALAFAFSNATILGLTQGAFTWLQKRPVAVWKMTALTHGGFGLWTRYPKMGSFIS